jgi:hypothetical protein
VIQVVSVSSNGISLTSYLIALGLWVSLAKGYIKKKREKMTAMCLDLSFINKFLIAWGIFLTIILPIHATMLTVYSAMTLFMKDTNSLEYE